MRLLILVGRAKVVRGFRPAGQDVDHAAGRGTHAWPRRDDTDEVQGIGSRRHQGAARRAPAAHRPQQLDRLRPGELLADEAGDEAPPP